MWNNNNTILEKFTDKLKKTDNILILNVLRKSITVWEYIIGFKLHFKQYNFQTKKIPCCQQSIKSGNPNWYINNYKKR